MSEARRIEAEAALWLARREDAGWSADDEARFQDWLQQSMAHKASYWRLEHGWRQADRIAAIGETPRPHGRAFAILPGWKVPMSIAALIALAAIVALPLLHETAPVPQPATVEAFSTVVGARKTIRLPDGSRVELNTASTIRAAVSGDARELWLDKGEAYFDVAHADGDPFIVHAGRQTITVLGTKFSVRRDGERVDVAVSEGRVRIDDARAERRGTIIAAGDTALLTAEATLLPPRSRERVANAMVWRRGRVNFDQERLADVAAEFSRYRAKPLVVTDAELADIRISGRFDANNADAFVRLLKDAYGLRTTETANATEISN